MSVERRDGSDGVAIARSVRNLARQAHEVMSGPARESDMIGVLDGIERLERQLEDGMFEGLARWAASLRREVERRAACRVLAPA